MQELRSLRLRRGLTQADLSDKSGVSEFTISEIEAGKRPNARPSTARKLAAGLGVDVAHLYGEAMPNPKVSAPPSLDWALSAPESEFDSWVDGATSMELHKLFLSLDKYAEGIEVGKRYRDILGRAQKAIHVFFERQGIDREKSRERWPSAAVGTEDREAAG